MCEIDKIRESIANKISKIEGNGTISMSLYLDPLELAVYESDNRRIYRLLDARICPNCTFNNNIVKLVKKKGFLSRKWKCPKCGFTLNGC